MRLASIDLSQFSESTWVDGLINLANDFFKESAVICKHLYVEAEEIDNALNFLNEASGMDFKYVVYKQGSVKEVKELYNEFKIKYK